MRGSGRALASSPSPARIAITVPTFTSSVPSGDQDLGDDAFVDRFEFHRRLVGLDLGEHGAGGDGVALP
jgi:hypothetical protein